MQPAVATQLAMLTPTGGLFGNNAGQDLKDGFSDDFSNPDSGWPTLDGPVGKAAYSQGGYHIQLGGSHPGLIGGLDISASDIHQEVDAALITGEPGFAAFGLICREDASAGYYRMIIGVDGAAAIQRVEGDSITTLAFLPAGNDIVNSGAGENNHIQSVCVGSTLSLTVNGKAALSVSDDALTGGGFGLTAHTQGADLSVLFDNFSVSFLKQ